MALFFRYSSVVADIFAFRVLSQAASKQAGRKAGRQESKQASKQEPSMKQLSKSDMQV